MKKKTFLSIVYLCFFIQVFTQETIVTVVNRNSNGPGSLHQAILDINALGNTGVINFADSLAGKTITLKEKLPYVEADLTINGNSVAISGDNKYQSGFYISPGKVVKVSRVHFKEGRFYNYGGAIFNNGSVLSLESCIFSSNKTGNWGGAIGTLNGQTDIKGCTFYNNTAGINGGVIYYENSIVSFIGTLFKGNTSPTGGTNDYSHINSNGYNVYDNYCYNNDFNPFTATGDKEIEVLAFTPVSFKLLHGSEAKNVITIRPDDYPTTDFYGNSIPATNAASGAVQETAAPGYFIESSSDGPGDISFTFNPEPDDDGILSAGSIITLTATPNSGTSGAAFRYFSIDGIKNETNPLQISINNTIKVIAVFGLNITVTNRNNGAGSLHQAVTDVNSTGGVGIINIADSLAGKTITLTENIPIIETSLTINGNGITILGDKKYQSGFFIYGNSVIIDVNRVHFKDGCNNFGSVGSIYNLGGGTLTLNSCIFSGNGIKINNDGGFSTINNTGTLNIQGCTFYNNYAGGGVINNYNKGNTTLTGNLFYHNASEDYSFIINNSDGIVTDNCYNVYDITNIDFDFSTICSKKVTELSFTPVSYKLLQNSQAKNVITSLPNGYPTTDFYGNSIPATNAAAGAVQSMAASGFFISYFSRGPGSVSLTSDLEPDADGILPSGSIIQIAATPENCECHAAFCYFLENGDTNTINPLRITLNKNTEVCAVFAYPGMVEEQAPPTETAYEYVVNPFVQPNDSTLNWYGSGDVNNDNAINQDDVSLLEEIINGSYTNPNDRRLNDRADVNGDALINYSDKTILQEYIIGTIEYLPGQWNDLLTKEEKQDWLQKMINIDNPDKTCKNVPDSIICDCSQYADQMMINFHGFTKRELAVFLKSYSYDTANNGRFNLPVYIMGMQYKSADGLGAGGHARNWITHGEDVLDWNNNFMIEPQHNAIEEINENYFDLDDEVNRIDISIEGPPTRKDEMPFETELITYFGFSITDTNTFTVSEGINYCEIYPNYYNIAAITRKEFSPPEIAIAFPLQGEITNTPKLIATISDETIFDRYRYLNPDYDEKNVLFCNNGLEFYNKNSFYIIDNGERKQMFNNTNTTLEGLSEGEHILIVTSVDEFGNKSEETINFVYNLQTTVNETELNEIKVYPNPADNYVYFEFSNLSGKVVTIEMYNSSGQLVDKQITNNNNFKYSVSTYPLGIYMYKITNVSGSIMGVGKIIKE